MIKAVFAYYASIGTFAGPKTPGSAYVLLHHLMGEHQGAGGWGFIKGGMGMITQAIAQSGARFGLEVKTDSGGRQGAGDQTAGPPASSPKAATSTTRRWSSRISTPRR